MTKTRFGMYMVTALAVTLASAVPSQATPVRIAVPDAASFGALGTPGWRVQDESVERQRGRHYRHRGYYRNRGVDAGDVIAGVLILGGIAAIASAANRNAERHRYDDRAEPYSEPRPRSGSSELNSAADTCAYAAEDRAGGDARLGEITSVERDGNGWQVQGSVESYGQSQTFLCGVTDGRIDYLQIDESGY